MRKGFLLGSAPLRVRSCVLQRRNLDVGSFNFCTSKLRLLLFYFCEEKGAAWLCANLHLDGSVQIFCTAAAARTTLQKCCKMQISSGNAKVRRGRNRVGISPDFRDWAWLATSI